MGTIGIKQRGTGSRQKATFNGKYTELGMNLALVGVGPKVNHCISFSLLISVCKVRVSSSLYKPLCDCNSLRLQTLMSVGSEHAEGSLAWPFLL